jgi:hypothetical protein
MRSQLVLVLNNMFQDDNTDMTHRSTHIIDQMISLNDYLTMINDGYLAFISSTTLFTWLLVVQHISIWYQTISLVAFDNQTKDTCNNYQTCPDEFIQCVFLEFGNTLLLDTLA